MHPSILFRFLLLVRLVRCVPFYFAPFLHCELVACRALSWCMPDPVGVTRGKCGGNYSLCIQNVFCKQSKCHYKQIGLCAMLFVLCCGPLHFWPANGVGTASAASSHRWEIAQVRLGGAHEQSLQCVWCVMTRRGDSLAVCVLWQAVWHLRPRWAIDSVRSDNIYWVQKTLRLCEDVWLALGN